MSTIDTTKGYSSKSNAKRAMKGQETAYFIEEVDGKFYLRPIPAKKSEKAPKGEGKPRNGNCHKVWEIADSMKGERRKHVVAACVAAGVPLGTAKTQYQSWFKSTKG